MRDEFLENARLFIFETYCRIHQRIDMGYVTGRFQLSIVLCFKYIPRIFWALQFVVCVNFASSFDVSYSKFIEKSIYYLILFNVMNWWKAEFTTECLLRSWIWITKRLRDGLLILSETRSSMPRSTQRRELLSWNPIIPMCKFMVANSHFQSFRLSFTFFVPYCVCTFAGMNNW